MNNKELEKCLNKLVETGHKLQQMKDMSFCYYPNQKENNKKIIKLEKEIKCFIKQILKSK